MKRKRVLFSLIGSLFLTSLLTACSQEEQKVEAKLSSDYPNKTITMIVPFAAGGSGDIMSREVARISEEFFGQKVVIENKEGGSGAIALNDAINRKADGYTILNHSSTLPLTMASGQIPFKPEDIEPLATMVSNYQILAVPVDSAFKTYEDFVAFAKENPRKLNIASSQTNGTNHLLALKLMSESEIDFNYVGYDGGGEALVRILGGNADAIVASGEVVQQQVESGELRLLGVSSSERVPLHPDVPTFKEMGLTSIDDELIWRGYFVKPGTPPQIKEKIIEVLKKVSETPEFKDYATKTNQDIYFKSGEELETIINDYYEDGQKLLGDSK
ncbi:Bug family tripartite tricarboxylate transporter substrate binding protein [Psychrobacillus sp. NPDC093180]|uniref:Bug family tripartite tricarboxylate transporter substrate binding protein n=1 Tax=Psychrobacillus sp. NPDC093180 TaxID=3364489 RepID=UPI003803C78F